MNVSVILAHPAPGSLNHAIAAEAVATLRKTGYAVTYHDLYLEGFDPLLSGEEIPIDATLPEELDAYCREVASADGLVIVHPNWWGQPPAVLKGWVDRVLRPGVAYSFLEGDGGEGIPLGLLKAKTAIVFNTSNTPPEREQSVFGDPLELIWKNCIFGLCGVRDVRRVTFSTVVTSSPELREAWLATVRETVTACF